MALLLHESGPDSLLPDNASTRPQPIPRRRLADEAAAMPPPLLGLSFTGRIDRLQWLTGLVMLGVGAAIVQVVARKHSDLVPDQVHLWTLMLGALLTLRLAALRFHDRNRNAWWCLALLAPGLNVLALVELCLLPARDEGNRYGDMPNGGSVPQLAAGLAALTVFLGLGVLSFHPAYAIDALNAEAAEATRRYGSRDGAATFRGAYAEAAGYKAFAASASGGWGAHVAASSAAEAAAGALQTCEEHRRGTGAPCKLVDIDGRDARLHRNASPH